MDAQYGMETYGLCMPRGMGYGLLVIADLWVTVIISPQTNLVDDSSYGVRGVTG